MRSSKVSQVHSYAIGLQQNYIYLMTGCNIFRQVNKLADEPKILGVNFFIKD